VIAAARELGYEGQVQPTGSFKNRGINFQWGWCSLYKWTELIAQQSSISDMHWISLKIVLFSVSLTNLS
jgi:hypothetical protein